MLSRVASALLLFVVVGCPGSGPATPPPPPVDPLAAVVDAGRVHGDARWTNAVVGLELALDPTRWRLLSYEAGEHPRYARLGGGGQLTLELVVRGAEESLADATGRDVRAATSGPSMRFGPAVVREEAVAGWSAAFVARPSEVLVAPFSGMQLLREDAGVDVRASSVAGERGERGQVLRLSWIGPVPADGPPLDWASVLRGLRRLAPGETPEGGTTLAQARATKEEVIARIVAAGARDATSGIYTNEVLGVRCSATGVTVSLPTAAVRNDGTLFTVTGRPGVELPTRMAMVSLVPVSAHPRWFIAPFAASLDPTAAIERFDVAGWRAARAELRVSHPDLGDLRQAYLVVELGDRQLQFALTYAKDAPSPVPALVAELEASLPRPAAR